MTELPAQASTPLAITLKEARSLFTLTWPIMGGQIAQTANGFIDTVMAGRVSPLDLSIVAIGASIWVPVYLFLTGVILINTSFVAQLHGGKRFMDLSSQLQQALFVGLIFGFLCTGIIQLIAWLLTVAPINPDIQESARDYLQAISWGMPGMALFLALRSYCEGLSFTKPILVISVMGLLLNIPLNYIFIHGYYGGPALGGVGCGYATAIVMWVMFLILFTYMFFKPTMSLNKKSLQIMPDSEKMKDIITTGLPVGIAIFFEVSAFSIIALLLSSNGDVIVAAHQITLNFASLLFMIPLSISMAITIRTGFYYGEKNLQMLLLNSKLGIVIGVMLSVTMGSLLLIFRQNIPQIYSDHSEVIFIASGLLWYAAAFQFFDALQVCIFGILRGVKDTRWPMFITLVAYWVLTLPLGYTLAFTDYLTPNPMLAEGFWIALMSGLACAALLLSFRLFFVIGQLKKEMGAGSSTF